MGSPLQIAEQNQQQQVIDLINQFLQEELPDSDNEDDSTTVSVTDSGTIVERPASRHSKSSKENH